VWTLTIQEYLQSSRWRRFAYRLARNPAVLFVVAPLILFVVLQRFPSGKAPRRERHSVYWTNLAILGMAAMLTWIFGFEAYLCSKGGDSIGRLGGDVVVLRAASV